MKLIGIDNVLKTIDSYNIDTIPHSLILLGKEGSGKTSLCDYIAQKLNLSLVDITNDLSDELIDNIYRSPQPKVYKIDVRELPEKKQNVMLKFFEEPSKNAFIIVIANSKFQLLNTVLNRGFIIELPKYSKSILNKIALDNNVYLSEEDLELFDTPGEIVNVYKNNIDINVVKDLVKKIVDKMDKASFPNMLTIVDKLNFKDEYDKIDLNTFLKLLYKNYICKYIETKNDTFMDLAMIVNVEIRSITFDSRLNRKLLTSNMLTKIWKVMKSWN